MLLKDQRFVSLTDFAKRIAFAKTSELLEPKHFICALGFEDVCIEVSEALKSIENWGNASSRSRLLMEDSASQYAQVTLS